MTLSWKVQILADPHFPPFKTGTLFVLYRSEFDPQDGTRIKGTTVEQSCGKQMSVVDQNEISQDCVYGYCLVCVDPNRLFSLPSPLAYVRTDHGDH